MYNMSKSTNSSKKYYLGNANLPTDQAKFEYTPEMVNDLKKAKKNLLYFAEKFFYIVNLDTGRQAISLHKCQKRALRNMRDSRFVIMLASRQCGKTTMMTIYALWNACFNNDQRVLIVANKEGTAIEIFQRIRLAYEELPNWLKPGVKEYGKTSMVLANGSRVGISTTTGTAARGQSVNCLILDELAFIEPNLVDPFWNSVYPIISSSKKSKIFIASTPNGTENLFYRLYSGAITNENGWSPERIDWWEVPGRDEKWKEDTIKTMGSDEVFRQEFGNEFLETGESIVDEDLLDKLYINNSEPDHIFEDGHYKIWSTPSPDNTYVVGVDVGEGVDQAASVAQILDITDLTYIKQVAVFHSNSISPYNFTAKLHEILQHWGSPLALIERNNCGAQVVDNLKNQLNYENLVTYMPNMKKLDPNRIGVLAHTNTKYKGVMNMRYWINQLNAVVIKDKDTVHELKNFIRMPNGTWKARQGENLWDDRVMSLIWALMILESSLTERYFEILKYDDNGKPLKIESLYDDFKQFMNPLPIYDGVPGTSNALPISFGDDNMQSSDISELMDAGWLFPDDK
jgi:hypothetical protein